MRKLRKLVLTTAALAALAVGAAAFAQAQNAGHATNVTVQQPGGETSAPGDTDNIQSGDQSGPDQVGRAGPDQGGQAGEREDGGGSQSEAPPHETEAD